MLSSSELASLWHLRTRPRERPRKYLPSKPWHVAAANTPRAFTKRAIFGSHSLSASLLRLPLAPPPLGGSRSSDISRRCLSLFIPRSPFPRSSIGRLPFYPPACAAFSALRHCSPREVSLLRSAAHRFWWVPFRLPWP